MASVTVFLSSKVKELLNETERAEMVRQIGESVEKNLKVKTYPTLAPSTVSGPEVSVNLYDIGNISGMKSGFLAWQIKSIVIAFVLLKKFFLFPNDVRVESSLRTVV